MRMSKWECCLPPKLPYSWLPTPSLGHSQTGRIFIMSFLFLCGGWFKFLGELAEDHTRNKWRMNFWLLFRKVVWSEDNSKWKQTCICQICYCSLACLPQQHYKGTYVCQLVCFQFLTLQKCINTALMCLQIHRTSVKLIWLALKHYSNKSNLSEVLSENVTLPAMSRAFMKVKHLIVFQK